MKLSSQIYMFIITVLAVVLYISITDKREKVSHTNDQSSTDTVVCVKTDTVVERVVKYKERIVRDTVYIETENKPVLALPVVQKHYGKENLYDAWISGLEPLKMDSIKVYPKTEHKTITNTTIVEVHPQTWDLYANVGFSHFNGTFVPRVGVSLKTKKETLYGLNIGPYKDDLYIDVSVGFKIK